MDASFNTAVNFTYSIKEEKVVDNIALIEEVFHQLKKHKLKGVKYSVYLMGRNVFIHTAHFIDDKAKEEFRMLSAFRTFQSLLSERLEEAPIINEVEEIGFYADRQ